MAILTYTFTRKAFNGTVFNGTRESLADVIGIAGDQFDGVIDGKVLIRGHDNSITMMDVGWGIRLSGDGRVVTASPGAIADTWVEKAGRG